MTTLAALNALPFVISDVNWNSRGLCKAAWCCSSLRDFILTCTSYRSLKCRLRIVKSVFFFFKYMLWEKYAIRTHRDSKFESLTKHVRNLHSIKKKICKREYNAALFLVSLRLFSLRCPSSPTLDAFMKRTRVHVCRSLRYRSCTYRAHDVLLVRAHARVDTRARFPCRAAVWVEGTHGRRKQRIMVITVIKRQPLRTKPGSTWKIRCFTSECGGTLRRESTPTARE